MANFFIRIGFVKFNEKNLQNYIIIFLFLIGFINYNMKHNTRFPSWDNNDWIKTHPVVKNINEGWVLKKLALLSKFKIQKNLFVVETKRCRINVLKSTNSAVFPRIVNIRFISAERNFYSLTGHFTS